MKAAAQFVLELLRGDEEDSKPRVEAFADEYLGIPLDDYLKDEDYTDRSWAYYVDTFRCTPTKAGDLLLGIGLNEGCEWWVPIEHPIAQLLDGHGIEASSEWSGMLCYDRANIVLGQQSLARLFNDKALSSHGALWDVVE